MSDKCRNRGGCIRADCGEGLARQCRYSLPKLYTESEVSALLDEQIDECSACCADWAHFVSDEARIIIVGEICNSKIKL